VETKRYNKMKQDPYSQQLAISTLLLFCLIPGVGPIVLRFIFINVFFRVGLVAGFTAARKVKSWKQNVTKKREETFTNMKVVNS